jgi:hypothetical protein
MGARFLDLQGQVELQDPHFSRKTRQEMGHSAWVPLRWFESQNRIPARMGTR